MADASHTYLYLALAVVSLLAVLLASRRKRSTTAHVDGGKLRLPPGPWQLPIIGSLHHMVGKLPHRAMHDLERRHGADGVMTLQLGEIPTVVVSSPDAARVVLRTNDAAFATRHLSASIGAATRGGRNMAFAPYGDYWRALRKVAVSELLGARRVASLRSIREEEVRAALRAFAAEQSPVEMQAELTRLVANSTVRAVIGDGDRCRERDDFLRQLERANKLATVFNPVDVWPSSRLANFLSSTVREIVGCVDRVSAILDGIIQEHLEKKVGDGGKEDFLDVLLRIHKDGGLDMDAIKYLIMDVFAGGSDTSATLLEWTLAELIRNPNIMAKATAEVRQAFAEAGTVSEGSTLGELRYLQLIIKESLRLHPPVPLLLPRECQELSQVLGYDVPRGTQVLVNVWAISRDERYWPGGKTEEFWPERFDDGEAAAGLDFKGNDFEFFPFGAGRRMCPGMTLVLANAELTIASLLFHFDWEVPGVADPTKLDMTEVFGVTARRKDKLLLRPILRVPLPGV